MPTHKRPLDLSRRNLSMATAPYRDTLKRIAKRWRSKNVITSMGLGFTIFCSVSSDNFFVVIYTFFIFSVDYFFVSYLKKTKKLN